MTKTYYRIADEPAPGALAHLAVSPLWPFVAVMFGGAWLSWGWFVVNGIAVGSPTRRREWCWVGAGLIGSALLVFALYQAAGHELLAENQLRYAMLLLVVWKLGVTYMLYHLQGHTIELYEYYGGRLRNGVVVVIVAAVAGPALLAPLPGYLRMVLG